MNLKGNSRNLKPMLDSDIKTKDKCPRCKERRKENYMVCDECGNELWETPNMRVRIGGNITTGNTHQGLH